jgi:hypothetical protein
MQRCLTLTAVKHSMASLQVATKTACRYGGMAANAQNVGLLNKAKAVPLHAMKALGGEEV